MHEQLISPTEIPIMSRMQGSSLPYGREVPRHMLLSVSGHVPHTSSYKAEWLHLL